MNKLNIAALAALLTGCASAPQPKIEANVSYPIAEPRAEIFHEFQSLPQPAKPKPEILRPPRKVDANAKFCLAQAMYWEARGEGREGMLAVSSVVLNRVEDERFPDTVCGVVYEGGESPPCQFSWWCDGKSDEPANEAMWSETLNLAHTVLATRPEDPTDGALFYHSTSIRVPWRREQTARIGNHIFYR